MDANWTAHAGELFPIVVSIGQWLIGVIGVLGASLIAVLVWIGKQFTGKVGSMESKLDGIRDAMLGCDGCRTSVERRGRGTNNDINLL